MAKERPIPLRGWEVRAVQDGRKTQMRRIVNFKDSKYDLPLPHVDYARDGMPIWSSSPMPDNIRESDYFDNGFPCPLGTVGDRLWVREAFDISATRHPPDFHAVLTYKADGFPIEFDGSEIDTGRLKLGKSYPSIHMPRWASRITLEITGVRVERLQDISEVDAISEGMSAIRSAEFDKKHFPEYCKQLAMSTKKPPLGPSPRETFKTYWRSIHGPELWAANPWVWCILFRRIA